MRQEKLKDLRESNNNKMALEIPIRVSVNLEVNVWEKGNPILVHNH